MIGRTNAGNGGSSLDLKFLVNPVASPTEIADNTIVVITNHKVKNFVLFMSNMQPDYKENFDDGTVVIFHSGKLSRKLSPRPGKNGLLCYVGDTYFYQSGKREKLNAYFFTDGKRYQISKIEQGDGSSIAIPDN